MKKHLLGTLVFVIAVAVFGPARAEDPPTANDVPETQQVEQLQQLQQMQFNNALNVQGAVGRAGEGKLMKLPVPKAEIFEAEQGRTGWRVKIPGGRPLATPAVSNGTLFVGGGFGSYEFYALNTKNGQPAWTFKCGDDGPTAAVVAEGCVAYNTESCTIYVQDAVTGEVLWHRWLGDPLMSQPAIAGGKVFMAYPGKGGHRLAAFRLRKGKVVWDQPIQAEIITAPIVAGDFVVAASVDGTLYKFNLATGKLEWKKDYKVTSAPRVVGDQILISQKSEKKIKIKSEPGKEQESTVTLEGLNIVALDDGAIQYDEPLAAVKASFLLHLAGQRGYWAANATLHFNGQKAYRGTLHKSITVFDNVAGLSKDQLAELKQRIDDFNSTKPTKEAAGGQNDAESALALANDLDKLAENLSDEGNNKRAREQLAAIAGEVREKAEATREAAEAAEQAEETITATEAQQAKDQADDASVGFAEAPQAAQLGKAVGNIGQANVKAVWAYQGSRPCLHDGLSIMVHGPKMRAVEIKTGKVVWEHRFDFKAKATRPVTPPALAGGKLYLGTVDGRVLCHDADTGKALWQAKVGGRIVFELAVSGGRIFAATADGTLVCLDAKDPTADGWHMWGGSASHNGS
jgi:outer membrane protein assembly factor BamB